ncbi:MAG: lipopolysaccharide biosynthesis glycosyltransferase [Bacteroidetes bacterium]|nr:lipopolysaccharide biosynthesis glycosyltransferase [Bacteroidota bacterium]
MKILQIGKFYPIRGGVEKVMHDLMLGLSKRGVHCDMLCAANEDALPGTHELNTHARLLCVPVWKKLAATMIAPSMIGKLFQIKNEYDIIHIHHPDPMACLALFFSGYKGKVILHWHSDILKQKTLLHLYKPFQSWMIHRADLILGTSPVYVKESPFLKNVQNKIDYVPIGVEAIVTDASSIDSFRKKYFGRKLIFSLGRLVEYKGYEYLIKAAQYISDEYLILIGGTGPLHDALSNLIEKLDVRSKVELIGFVKDEDIPTYFGACHLFCLSSIWKTEAFAIVQIEAMSCAKPLISTRISGSGVSWVNAHNESGLTVPVEDEKALAEAITSILSDDDKYNQLSKGAKNRYLSLFTQEKMVDKCLKSYENMLKSDGFCLRRK